MHCSFTSCLSWCTSSRASGHTCRCVDVFKSKLWHASHVSSPYTCLQLFVRCVNALLDITIRYQQHRHFIPAKEQNLFRKTKVQFV